MYSNFEVCRDCIYCASSNNGPICKAIGGKPNFKFVCPNFKPNSAEHDRYIKARRQRMEELRNEAETTVNIGAVTGCVAIVAALIIAYFNIGFIYMLLALLLAAATFIIVIIRYSRLQETITNVKCELHADRVNYSAHVAPKKEVLPNPVITTEGIVQHLKNMGYSPTVQEHENVEWIAFMYGRHMFHIAYVQGRLHVTLGFSRTPNDVEEPAFMIAANRVMLDIAHTRIYIDNSCITFELFNNMKYMDELREHLGSFLMLVENTLDAHAYYYRHVIEQGRSTEQNTLQPTNSGIIN